jgi:hypothetical protein
MHVIRHEAVRRYCEPERSGTLPNGRQHWQDHFVGCEDALPQVSADSDGITMQTDVVEPANAAGSSWKHAASQASNVPTALKGCATFNAGFDSPKGLCHLV